jgi:hypothetical protein
MSRSKRTVTHSTKEKTDRLPEWANEGALLVNALQTDGWIDAIGDRLRIQREGGFVGVDLVLFLLYFLTARLDGGIKGFAVHAAEFGRQLAAIGGKKRLPTPASVSRMLQATNVAHALELAEWLLFDVCGAKAILSHPSVVTRDASAWPGTFSTSTRRQLCCANAHFQRVTTCRPPTVAPTKQNQVAPAENAGTSSLIA